MQLNPAAAPSHHSIQGCLLAVLSSSGIVSFDRDLPLLELLSPSYRCRTITAVSLPEHAAAERVPRSLIITRHTSSSLLKTRHLYLPPLWILVAPSVTSSVGACASRVRHSCHEHVRRVKERLEE
jgi:hypothetical protein